MDRLKELAKEHADCQVADPGQHYEIKENDELYVSLRFYASQISRSDLDFRLKGDEYSNDHTVEDIISYLIGRSKSHENRYVRRKWSRVHKGLLNGKLSLSVGYADMSPYDEKPVIGKEKIGDMLRLSEWNANDHDLIINFRWKR